MLDFLSSSDYKKIRDNFLSELTLASKDQPDSISYYRHIFPKKPIVSTGLVQAFVIGGTNYQVGLARILKNGEIKEIQKNRKQGEIPTFHDAKTFLRFIKKNIDPKVKAISINFAYPLQPIPGKFGEVDSILHIGTKEHIFKELVGKAVGEAIRTYTKLNVPIFVVNDTVCLGRNGLVVGTGFNFSLQGTNLEAGNFNKFPSTPELETLDASSANPGGHRFEKFLSGTYLPSHFNLIAKKQKLAVKVKDGQDISNLAENDSGPAGDLARMLLQRSASLVASALAAAYKFANKKTLNFTTEGSMFWQGFEFEAHVKNQLLILGVPKGAIRFKKITDSSLKGAFALLTRTK